MRLLSLTIRNYRVHKDLTVTFDPSRNLIGDPNECGKSTLAEAAHRANASQLAATWAHLWVWQGSSGQDRADHAIARNDNSEKVTSADSAARRNAEQSRTRHDAASRYCIDNFCFYLLNPAGTDQPRNSLRNSMNADPSHLFKLRLAVARFGEMDGAGWWNTKGILGTSGKSVLTRGFPKTHLFAQARIACSVAAARCNSVFAPPGCLTLWNLSAEIEDQIAVAWPGWCRNPDPWSPFFNDLSARNSGDLLQHLLDLELIDEKTVTAVSPLKRTAEGKAVPLPGTGKPELRTLMLLAAAFSKGEKLKPAIPYVRLDS